MQPIATTAMSRPYGFQVSTCIHYRAYYFTVNFLLWYNFVVLPVCKLQYCIAACDLSLLLTHFASILMNELACKSFIQCTIKLYIYKVLYFFLSLANCCNTLIDLRNYYTFFFTMMNAVLGGKLPHTLYID